MRGCMTDVCSAYAMPVDHIVQCMLATRMAHITNLPMLLLLRLILQITGAT
jgi:hypothetical protein